MRINWWNKCQVFSRQTGTEQECKYSFSKSILLSHSFHMLSGFHPGLLNFSLFLESLFLRVFSVWLSLPLLFLTHSPNWKVETLQYPHPEALAPRNECFQPALHGQIALQEDVRVSGLLDPSHVLHPVPIGWLKVVCGLNELTPSRIILLDDKFKIWGLKNLLLVGG